MVEHCDFSEQVHLRGRDGRSSDPTWSSTSPAARASWSTRRCRWRPTSTPSPTDDPDEQQAHLARHARQVRGHVDQLSAKAYWRALDQSPEFVVLFLPAESFLSAALEAEPGLLEYAAARNVVLATPTTLIALLRTVAYGWTTETLAERTREIHELGRELYARLGVVGRHLDKLGRSLKGSVDAYNSDRRLAGDPGVRHRAPLRRRRRPRRAAPRPRAGRGRSARRSPRPSCSRPSPRSGPSCPIPGPLRPAWRS